jgi:NaMN:DMB phosphoribosyltransferase
MTHKGVVAHREFNNGGCMTDDEIIASAHRYIEFDQGKIDGATLNAELAKCLDTGELIAVGTAYKMLKGRALVISSDTPDNPLNDRSKQIARRLTGSVKEDVGTDPLRLVNSWGDLRGMPRDITGDLAASPT